MAKAGLPSSGSGSGRVFQQSPKCPCAAVSRGCYRSSGKPVAGPSHCPRPLACAHCLRPLPLRLTIGAVRKSRTTSLCAHCPAPTRIHHAPTDVAAGDQQPCEELAEKPPQRANTGEVEPVQPSSGRFLCPCLRAQPGDAWGFVITQITPQPISRRRWQPQESLQSRVPRRFCASTLSLLGNQVGVFSGFPKRNWQQPGGARGWPERSIGTTHRKVISQLSPHFSLTASW